MEKGNKLRIKYDFVTSNNHKIERGSGGVEGLGWVGHNDYYPKKYNTRK